MTERRVRYGLPDAFRGLAMISMVVYHAMYDLVAIYGLDVPWYFDTPGYIWQQTICWSFIFISGMCWGMSSNRLKKGIKISLCGVIISLATLIAMPSQLIIMGVLSFLGAAAIIMIPFSKLAKGYFWLWFFAMAALFFITREINSGYLGFEGIRLLTLPQWLYDIPLGFILGFVPRGFYSSDYFSLLPWFFLFAAGHFFWNAAEKSEAFSCVMQKRVPLLSSLGRKSLIVYMLHQPVIMLVLWLVMGR